MISRHTKNLTAFGEFFFNLISNLNAFDSGVKFCFNYPLTTSAEKRATKKSDPLIKCLLTCSLPIVASLENTLPQNLNLFLSQINNGQSLFTQGKTTIDSCENGTIFSFETQYLLPLSDLPESIQEGYKALQKKIDEIDRCPLFLKSLLDDFRNYSNDIPPNAEKILFRLNEIVKDIRDLSVEKLAKRLEGSVRAHLMLPSH